MQITINNHSYEASVGDRLLDIARSNHAHIGYFCGGNGICQTCYVTVLEGAELLCPLTEQEKAQLSDPLISEGTRMACLATIEREGTIRIVSAVEEVKEMLLHSPLELAGYAAKMGREALVKFPETMSMQAKRSFDLWQLLSDVIGAIDDALQLTLDAILLAPSPRHEVTVTADGGKPEQKPQIAPCSSPECSCTPDYARAAGVPLQKIAHHNGVHA